MAGLAAHILARFAEPWCDPAWRLPASRLWVGAICVRVSRRTHVGPRRTAGFGREGCYALPLPMEPDAEHAARRRAVALKYKRGEDAAPKVVAKGSGLVADHILKLAEQYQVPIYHDPDLVEVLAQVELEQIIPPELYKAVADVLAWVYTVNQDLGGRRQDL